MWFPHPSPVLCGRVGCEDDEAFGLGSHSLNFLSPTLSPQNQERRGWEIVQQGHFSHFLPCLEVQVLLSIPLLTILIRNKKGDPQAASLNPDP